MNFPSLPALAGKDGRRLLPSRALPARGPGAWALFAALGVFLLPMARGQEKAAPQKRQASKPSSAQERKLPILLNRARHAVDLGLDWLARHQDQDGKWSASRFNAHCKGAGCSGPGAPIHDVGVTGLALLAFLGKGNSPVRGNYRNTVKRAVLWLKGIQKNDGLFGGRTSRSFMYSHLIAAIAMVRAFGESREVSLQKAAQRAVNYIAEARNPYKAWRYFPRSGDNDSSVTGWAVTALAWAKAYANLGLQVQDKDFQGPLAWYNQMTDPKTGRVGYITKGSLPARPQALLDRFPAGWSESITAEALYVRLILGLDPAGHPSMLQGARLIRSKPPVWNRETGSIDMYYWYYGTLSAREMGGEFWRFWRKKVLEALLPHQEKTGCARGSWDPAGVWGKEAGRVYSTSLAVAILEACLPPAKGRMSPRGAVRISFPPVAGIKISTPLVLVLKNAGTQKKPEFRISRMVPNRGAGRGPSYRPIPEKQLLPFLKKARREGTPKLTVQVGPGVPSAFLAQVLEKARKSGFPEAKVTFLH